jgi:hypothetical protein
LASARCDFTASVFSLWAATIEGMLGREILIMQNSTHISDLVPFQFFPFFFGFSSIRFRFWLSS